VSQKINKNKFDFDYRISQRFSLPYKNYEKSDVLYLELLDILKNEHDFSLEWVKEEKKFNFIVFEGDFGLVTSGATAKEAVTSFFHRVLEEEININLNRTI